MQKCPVCGAESRIWKKYDRACQEKAYAHYYDESLDLKIIGRDYNMLICKECGLVFADPLIAGDERYYTWVTQHEGYYPTADNPRGEWIQVVDYIRKKKVRTVLEVGCGSGEFLLFCKQRLEGMECIGIDSTESSYMQCLGKGLNAFHGTIGDYVAENPEKKFDMVVSFHCLEHVEDPVGFVRQMLRVCTNGGKCICSFPYSDTRIEPWIDPLNFPPHHMTRWCEKSYLKLAEVLGCSIEAVAPFPMDVPHAALCILRQTFLPIYKNGEGTKEKMMALCIRHPFMTIKELMRQAGRDVIEASTELGGRMCKRKASWVVMCSFTRNDTDD